MEMICQNGHWMAGILSVAGASGSTQTGYVYQNGPKLTDSDNVVWRAEVWYPATGYSVTIVDDDYVGEDTYPFFFVRMDMDDPTDYVRFSCYVYTSDYNVEHDICTEYEEWADISALSDNNFLYGKNTIDSIVHHTLQAGVESNAQISETSWKVRNGHISAYISSSWRYKRAKAVQGDDAAIIRVSGVSYGVGGDDADADDYSYGAAAVTWMRDSSSPITTDSTLWTSEGTTTQTVSNPFS